jgi:hypothetical protein
LAAIAYAGLDCSSQLHGSGAWTNFMEHGGQDAALLNSVSNTLASCTSIVIPHLGACCAVCLLCDLHGMALPQHTGAGEDNGIDQNQN